MPTPEQLQILTILAEEWRRNGPPGIMDIKKVVATAYLTHQETLSVINELFQKGLIDTNKFKTAVFLTPEGYSAAESDPI